MSDFWVCSRCNIQWEMGTRVLSNGRVWDNSNCPQCGRYGHTASGLENPFTVTDPRVQS